MDNEKRLYDRGNRGRIVLHDHRHPGFQLRGKRVKVVQFFAAALLLCLLLSFHFDATLFFARNWIEDVASSAGDEMICDFNEVRLTS
jgi:hypothetical protein